MDGMIVILALGAIVAGFVQGLSGFGFSLVAMSFWAWSIEPRLAATMAVFGALTGQIIAAVTVRRGFQLKHVLPFVAGGIVGIPIGTAILPLLDPLLFKTFLGLLLVVLCPIMLMVNQLPPITRGGRIVDSIIGAIGGAMGALGGFTGVVPTLWCTLRGFDKDVQRIVIQNFNLAVLLVTMASYIATGIVTRDMLPMFAIVGPAMLIPSVLGARLYIGIKGATFRKIVLSLLSASGVALLAASVPKLMLRLTQV
ncbi:MAG: putative inner rane protein [Noviherbaspirillum sp.]|nr:putative inner rane protein [Noviherbaspirillum sp.]